jgi:hypothetical protein
MITIRGDHTSPHGIGPVSQQSTGPVSQQITGPEISATPVYTGTSSDINLTDIENIYEHVKKLKNQSMKNFEILTEKIDFVKQKKNENDTNHENTTKKYFYRNILDVYLQNYNLCEDRQDNINEYDEYVHGVVKRIITQSQDAGVSTLQKINIDKNELLRIYNLFLDEYAQINGMVKQIFNTVNAQLFIYEKNWNIMEEQIDLLKKYFQVLKNNIENTDNTPEKKNQIIRKIELLEKTFYEEINMEFNESLNENPITSEFINEIVEEYKTKAQDIYNDEENI